MCSLTNISINSIEMDTSYDKENEALEPMLFEEPKNLFLLTNSIVRNIKNVI